MSPPSKKVKEDDISVEENDTEEKGNKNDVEVEEVQEEERTQGVITEEETTLEDDDLERVRVWLTIRAKKIKQKCDILAANLCTFHLDPSIVQRFAQFSAQISVLYLYILCLE